MEFYEEFDDDYLERLRAGDYRTQEHFVVYFSELLQIKLRSRMRSVEDVEDARQETFARFFDALRKENRIRNAKQLGPYVHSICVNVMRERCRRPLSEQMDDYVANNIPDPGMSALERMAREETKRWVREVLDVLPERDRRILKEVFLEERDKDVVCKEFGITRDNLRVVLLRAKQKFRAKIRKQPPGPEGKAAD